MVLSWRMNGYSVMFDGVPIQCQTAEDAVRLAKEVATLLGGVVQMAEPKVPPPAPPSSTPSPSAAQLSLGQPADVAGEAPSKWTEPAKRIIVLLVGAGSSGVDVERIKEVGGLKGTKGSAPLLKEIIKLLGVDNGAVDRPR